MFSDVVWHLFTDVSEVSIFRSFMARVVLSDMEFVQCNKDNIIGSKMFSRREVITNFSRWMGQ